MKRLYLFLVLLSFSLCATAQTLPFWSPDSIIRIPVVVHVIHDYGNAIKDEKIKECIQLLNDAFNSQLTDTFSIINSFKGNIPGTSIPYRGKANIKFVLANKDPNGNTTTGINRYRSYYAKRGSYYYADHQWDRSRYMNIWFFEHLVTPPYGSIALTPQQANIDSNKYMDGIHAWGGLLNFDKREIILSAGSWAGLPQMFMGSSQNCFTPQIDDMPFPIYKSSSNSCYVDTVCTGYSKTYTTAEAIKYFNNSSYTYIDYPDTPNFNNFMNPGIICNYMFTHFQTIKVREVLKSNIAQRSSLSTQSNITGTGINNPSIDMKPVADFYLPKYQQSITDRFMTDKVYFCIDNLMDVDLADRSWRDTIIDFSADISNTYSVVKGTGKITARFNQPGWVTVKWYATGNNTGTDTLITRPIYIADPVATAASGYYQEFNNTVENERWPVFNYYNNKFKWELSTTGLFDNSSMVYRGYDHELKNINVYPYQYSASPKGDIDDFFSPAIDFSNTSFDTTYLSFYRAGAYTTSNNQDMNDTFQVLYSKDCGKSWHVLYQIDREDIGNNGLQIQNFIPSYNQWKYESVAIPSSILNSKPLFRFRYMPGASTSKTYPVSVSNNFYIDRIHFSRYATDIEALKTKNKNIIIFPNPAHDQITLLINGEQEDFYITLTDITGKKVIAMEIPNISGTTEHRFDLKDLNKGIYVLTVASKNINLKEKLVVQ